MTETLDRRGLLEEARGSGTYALELDVPDSVERVRELWFGERDVAPGEGGLERLADGGRVAYVGASGDVYGRLCDHVAGDVRKAAVMEVFEPVGVVGVWGCSVPFEGEFGRALWVGRRGWVVWVDGRVVG